MSDHNHTPNNTPDNNSQDPENNSEVVDVSDTIINIGGSVDKALVGDYKLNVSAIAREAYQTTIKSRLSLNLALLFCIGLGLILTFVVSDFLGGIENAMVDPQASLLLNLVVTVCVYPFLVGVEMMGIYHAIGLKTKTKLVFGFLARGSWVAICALLTSTIINIGMAIILPAIYLAIALCLVLPLVVEKRLSPIKAMVISIKATRFQWFEMFKLHLLLGLGLIAAVLPVAIINTYMPGLSMIGTALFIFGLSYLAPLYYNIKGILYREIFGVTVSANAVKSQTNNDVFTA